MKFLMFSLISTLAFAAKYQYPEKWWAPIIDRPVPKWEILPPAGEQGVSVVLSKRNELGILSNFAATPFIFKGKKYASVEGLWQSMKYPEGENDPRSKLKYDLQRAAIEKMSGFKAKRAGKQGSAHMKKLGINWVTFAGKKMKYQTSQKGEHYKIIRAAMVEKLKQNPEVRKVLLSTGNLKLLPDHKTKPDSPPAWRYYKIWEELRAEVLQGKL